MLILSSALIALLLLLLVLKLSQRLTLRLRVLAGISVSRPASKSCPHLGLASDPFTHGERPSDDHRCYLWMQRDRIDLVHQKGFCLSTAHQKCPWLMVRRPDASPPLLRRLPQLPRLAWDGALAAFAALRAAWATLRARKPAQPLEVAGVVASGAPRRPTVTIAAPAVVHVQAPQMALPASAEGAAPGVQPVGLGLRWAAFCSLLGEVGNRLTAAFAEARAGLSEGTGTAWPHVRRGARVAAMYSWIALRWSARMLAKLALLAGRGGWWLTRAIARLSVAAAKLALRQGQAWAANARAKREAARLAAASAALRLEPVAAAVASPEGLVSEPVALPKSLAALEELLAEGVATLDRGQETLAYHLFVKATEASAPKGAGEEYADLMKRAWFWRAKTSETVEDVVHSLEQALRFDPQNLQMQAHLAWARQRLERELKLLMPEQAGAEAVAAAALPIRRQPNAGPSWWAAIGESVRRVGGLLALALAVLWATTGVVPALTRYLTTLPAADQALVKRLLLTINVTALPGQGHLPLPVLNFDLGLSLPFILAFLFVFTARGLVDGDSWARTGSLLLAGAGAWLCAACVSNREAGQLGLALCLGIIVAAIAGRFESPKVLPRALEAY